MTKKQKQAIRQGNPKKKKTSKTFKHQLKQFASEESIKRKKTTKSQT